MQYKILPFRIDEKTYNEIRDLAHVNHVSMAVIIRSSIKNLLEDHKKKLTQTNITI